MKRSSAVAAATVVGMLVGSGGLLASNFASPTYLNLFVTGSIYTASRVITGPGDVVVGPNDYDIDIAKAVSEPTSVIHTCTGTPNRLIGVKDDLGVDLQYPISIVLQSGTIDGRPATPTSPYVLASSTYGKPPYNYVVIKCDPAGQNATTR